MLGSPNKSARVVLLGAALAAATYRGRAETPPHDPAAPEADLRVLSTDRPDKTETPFTVDAGHWQVELELLRHVHDREDHGGTEHTTEEWSVGPILIKRGLLPNLDLEVALEPYRDVRETTREAGVTRETRRQGFGDVAFRAKLNLWGNDDSPTALGLLPFLVLPTSQDGLGAATAGGGILLPFYLELPHAFELGAQTGAMGSGDGEADEARAGLVNSVTLGRSFGRRLSAYVEFWSLVDPATPAEWQGTFDFGLNVWLGDNLKFDAGLNLGVTEAAPDFNPFVGVSWRH